MLPSEELDQSRGLTATVCVSDSYAGVSKSH